MEIEELVTEDSRRQELSTMVAGGRSQEFLGKEYTVKDVEKWTEKQLNGHYETYTAALTAQTSASVTNIILKTYTSVVNWFTPVDTKALESELKSDNLITIELGKVSSSITLIIGGPLLALINGSIITAKNIVKETHETLQDDAQGNTR